MCTCTEGFYRKPWDGGYGPRVMAPLVHDCDYIRRRNAAVREATAKAAAHSLADTQAAYPVALDRQSRLNVNDFCRTRFQTYFRIFFADSLAMRGIEGGPGNGQPD